MSSTQDTDLLKRLNQLECHFTWTLRKEDTDVTDLLERLEEEIHLELGKTLGVARIYSCLGFVKFLLGFNDEALACFQKSITFTEESHKHEDDKLYIVAFGNLAWLHYHMEAFTECESYLTKVQEIKDKNPPISPSAPFANVIGEKGWILFKFSRKYYEQAKECFKKALEQEPDEGEWNAGLAILLYRTETKDTSSTESPAIQQLRRAIELNPDDDVLKALLGLKLSSYKIYDEAENLMEIALERSPENSHVIRYVAKFFRIKGLVKRSIALLKRATEKNPDSAFIHHQLALCYKRQIIDNLQYSRYYNKGADMKHIRNQCIYHLEKAITLKTGFIMAMSELALQYGQNKNITKAEEMFSSSFKTAEEKKDGQQLVHLHYGEFQQYSMRCESLAIKHYTECLKIRPSTYEGKKGAKSLRKIVLKRLRNSPRDGEAHGILGFIHKQQGYIEQAIECYDKALRYTHNDEYLSKLLELRLSLK